MNYEEFIKSKTIEFKNYGFDISKESLNPMLFDFQKDIVRWALKKGRAAIFADCGLGKTPMQLEWANQIYKREGGKILILAPLAVATQTQREGEKFHIHVNICESQADVKEGIIAAKIAAHAADIAKGVPGAADWDYRMSEARKNLDWEAMFNLSMDPEKARRYRAEAKPEKEDTCSMCGNFCAVKNTNRILDGEIVSIFDE